MGETDEFYITNIANCGFNVFLCFTAIVLNIVTLHAVGTTFSLPKTLRTLLLNLVVSDLSVGLLVHPLHIADLGMELGENTVNSDTRNSIKTAYHITANFLSFASFCGMMALTADSRSCNIPQHERNTRQS